MRSFRRILPLATLLLLALVATPVYADNRVRLCHWEPSAQTLEQRWVAPDQVSRRLALGDTMPTSGNCGPTAQDLPDLSPLIMCHLREGTRTYIQVLVQKDDLPWWLIENDADFVLRAGTTC